MTPTSLLNVVKTTPAYSLLGKSFQAVCPDEETQNEFVDCVVEYAGSYEDVCAFWTGVVAGADACGSICGITSCEDNAYIPAFQESLESEGCEPFDVCGPSNATQAPSTAQGEVCSTVQEDLQYFECVDEAVLASYESYSEICELYAAVSPYFVSCGELACNLACEDNIYVPILEQDYISFGCGTLDLCALPTNSPSSAPTFEPTNSPSPAPTDELPAPGSSAPSTLFLVAIGLLTIVIVLLLLTIVVLCCKNKATSQAKEEKTVKGAVLVGGDNVSL